MREIFFRPTLAFSSETGYILDERRVAGRKNCIRPNRAMRNFDYETLSEKLWDSELVSCLAKIHEYKGRQNLFLVQRPTELDRLLEIARVQSTESSNKIEGIVTTDARIKQLLSDKTTPRNRDESEIMGYRDVLKTIHENYEFIPLRPSYILQLHRDLLRRAGSSYAGRYKNVQNYINEREIDGTTRTRFAPLAPHETERAVEAICASYNATAARETVDPLILIPAFICDFLCIHPFNDGNGRMSRLLTLLLLYQNGYAVGKYISVERRIEMTKDAYYDALEAADREWHEGKNDPAPFIKYLLKIILACYIDLDERIALLEARGKGTAYEIVKACVSAKVGKFTGAEVLASCPSVGRSAALAALKKLCHEGQIAKIGRGRSTSYVRTDRPD